MSLSAYDIFMRLDGFEEESSTASSDEASYAEDPPDSSDRISEVQESDDDEEFVLSSVGSDSFLSINDNLSLDSAVLQERGSMIALPPEIVAGMRHGIRPPGNSQDGEQTILSSAPSGASIPPPEASQAIFAITPHPHFSVGSGIRSLSTTNTECLTFNFADEDSSAYSSSNGGAIVRRAAPYQVSHEAAVFERIANQLMGDATSQGSPAYWYNRLVSESDWDQFRVAAKAILCILEPKPSLSLLPLPPTPPQNALQEQAASTERVQQVSCCAEDHLPSDFICGLCHDVIVGACTLDCGCNSAMVCTSCWENNCTVIDNPHEVSDAMGFVWIDESHKCPSCQGDVNGKVYCHALDVAILHIIRDLPGNDRKLESLKQNYYSRLASWRATVYERNETRSKQISAHHDELLARLIQEEERVFWNPRKENNLAKATHGILFLGQAAVALLAATVASIGVNALARR